MTTAAPAVSEDGFINADAAAAILRPYKRTRHSVFTCAARGWLSAVPIGGRLFFRRSEVEALRERLKADRKRVRPSTHRGTR